MLDVEVQMQAAADDIPDEPQLIAWARAAWRRSGDDAEVVLRVTDEAESRQLNHDYRGIDKPTNVLSFPFEPIPQIELQHIGDLVLCAPVVEREAREQGKTASAHWAHMVVHGMLHLQGYDHQTDPQAVAMETLETDILTGLGFPAPYSDDEET
ncbi:MAG: rRNA maturation RNase YbeY [Chromatiaceae bacterium]|nr:rRNA maturation RNase YbeY [Gammaproteobacteria bacterium]MCP5317888.1 rRNA maturation RNase YbeY [Chromatiaceae bacterium]MCP5429100.1 rRNA maturation RNase YbeY [Chromatiaceae bacterium]MCP5434640.1 rRNA maturation RNase YbeY [Chromatiaceae bacterium]HOP18218.1 rRNA maturation RNase YbeY [Gammaproteobacteria bacterium]